MKKILLFAVAVFVMTLMTACGGTSSTPSDGAKECVELMKAGDFKALVEKMHFDESMSAEQQQGMKDLIVSMGNEKISKEIEKKGGIKSYEVIEETIAEDGKTAVVKMKITYGDDSTKDEKYDMALVDDTWKPVVKK